MVDEQGSYGAQTSHQLRPPDGNILLQHENSNQEPVELQGQIRLLNLFLVVHSIKDQRCGTQKEGKRIADSGEASYGHDVSMDSPVQD